MAGVDLHKVSDADLQTHAHRAHSLVAVEIIVHPSPSSPAFSIERLSHCFHNMSIKYDSYVVEPVGGELSGVKLILRACLREVEQTQITACVRKPEI